MADADLAEGLAALDWPRDDLDPALPPRVAFAGAAVGIATVCGLALALDRFPHSVSEPPTAPHP